MLLLGRLVIGGIIAAIAASAIVIYIDGKITEAKIDEELREKKLEKALVQRIDKCNNVISLKDLDSDQEYEIHGDSIDDSMYTGQVITIGAPMVEHQNSIENSIISAEPNSIKLNNLVYDEEYEQESEFYVNGFVTKQRIGAELRRRGAKDVIVISNSHNVITLSDLIYDQEYVIYGDSIDSSLTVGEIIYV